MSALEPIPLPSPSATASSTSGETYRATSQDAADVVLRIGRALHRFGTPSPLLEDTLVRLSARLGIEGRFFSAPTALMVALGEPGSLRTELIRVDPGEVDLGRLADLHDVVEAIVERDLSPAEASRRVDAIEARDPRWSAPATVAAYTVASGTAAWFLGGGWTEIAVGAGLGTVIGALGAVAARRRPVALVFEPLAGFAATLLATAVAARVPVAVEIVVLAALIVLVPGLTMTVSMIELASRHLMSGTARLAGAAMTFIELGFGVGLGLKLGATAFGAPPLVASAALPAWTEWVALALSPVGLAVVLRAPRRDVPWVALAAVSGFTLARLGTTLLGPELGAFPAALAVAAASNLYARALGRPPMIPLVRGLMLLVPGSLGMRSFSAFAEGQVVSGLQIAFTVVMTAASIAAGALFANVLVPARRSG